MPPTSIFLRKEEEVGLTLPHPPNEGEEGLVLELLGRLFSASRKRYLASPTRSSRARLSPCTWAPGGFSRQFWQEWVNQAPTLLRGP